MTPQELAQLNAELWAPFHRGEEPEARFTRATEQRPVVRVRVYSSADLTDKHVVVKRANGSESRVRLEKLLIPSSADRPALYAFEQRDKKGGDPKTAPPIRTTAIESAGKDSNLLRPRPCPLRLFTLDGGAENLFLVAEDSDLPGKFEQVYKDACDVGLTVVYDRTDHEIVYAINHEERRDGDILFWDLVPAVPSQRHLPTVRVFND